LSAARGASGDLRARIMTLRSIRREETCVNLGNASHGLMEHSGTASMALISPSLLAADFARLGEALRAIKDAGASMVHLDVMDGHFVPEISVGQPVVQSIRKATDLALDLHLLIERPERYVSEFLACGADRIAIHAEATLNPLRVLGEIRARGAKAGLALNPSTAVESVAEVLGEADYLLLLSADLGYATAPYLPRTLDKVQSADAFRRDRRLGFAIQVDGSIGREQMEALAQAGADILVADSDIFQENPRERLAKMISLAASSRHVARI